jgi:hypothetical protein
MAGLRETAFYYPGVIWDDPGWVKSLTLFFDEIALLVPDYMHDRPLALDPAIAEPLADAGLLRILSPETLIGQDATERLAQAFADVIASGALDNLPSQGRFEELSWSRMGGFADAGLAGMMFEELHDRGLVQPSRDGVSIPMHGMVRSLYLVLLAQILREAGPSIGAELSPATDRPEVQQALVEMLTATAPTPGMAHVVSVDLEVVAPQLDDVPLDEIRQVVLDLATAEPEQREQLLNDRRAEVREAGEALRGGPMRMFGGAVGIGLGIAGGVATALSGGLLTGALAAGAAVSGVAALPRKTTTPYSYLFAIRRQLT